MKYLTILLALVLNFKFAYSESVAPEEIKTIKQAMYRAIESSRVTDSLYRQLLARRTTAPLLIAYIGTLEALKAKHSWNPYNKLKFVALSQKTLKTAISREAENLEIRFMRFSIQHYTPSFLGYSKNLDEDRRMIVKQFRHRSFGVIDSALLHNIARFMIDSKRCTGDEVDLLKRYA